MASKKGRKNANWRTAPGLVMKGVLNIKIKQNRNRAFVVGEFKRLIPDFQEFHRNPVSDGAIWGRADTGTRPGYEHEWPDQNPAIAKYMSAAEKIVAEGRPISAQELNEIVAAVDAGTWSEAQTEPKAEAQAESAGPNNAVAAYLGGYDYDEDEAEAPEEATELVVVPTSPPAPRIQPTAAPFRVLLGHAGFTTSRPAGPVYWNPAALMNPGVLVTGDSGSGKTQLLRAIADDVVHDGMPVCIFDFKNDYADPVFADPLGLGVYDVDRDGLPFNPVALIADDRGEVQAIRHIAEFVSILGRGSRLGDVKKH